MGTRGPLPKLKTYAAEKLRDDTPPDWLTAEAKAYWSKHAGHLMKNGLLNQTTADQFAIVCDLWARIRSMSGSDTSRAYLDTVKTHTALSKPFRLLPTDTPGTAPEHRHDDKPEFDFD